MNKRTLGITMISVPIISLFIYFVILLGFLKTLTGIFCIFLLFVWISKAIDLITKGN